MNLYLHILSMGMYGTPGMHQSLFQGIGGAARRTQSLYFHGLKSMNLARGEADSNQAKHTLRRKFQTGARAGKKISQVYVIVM